MARFMSVRRAVVQGLGAASLAFVLGHGAIATHAAPAARTVSMVGTWLGNALGDTGKCGKEYGQFTFFANGQYSYTENSDYNFNVRYPYTCGGITNAGYFSIRSGVLTLHWVRCNYPCTAGTASAYFRLISANAFELYDSGRVYMYYRQ